MAISAKDAFDHAFARAYHFLTLYDLLHDTRHRAIKGNWVRQFNKSVNWPITEKSTRVDGKGKKSILVLRQELNIGRDIFTHEYTSELLRASWAASVSALDCYMHHLIVGRSWSLLRQREEDVPKELLKLKLPVLAAKRSLDHLRKQPKSRPGTIMKKAIQEVLHREYTFQNTEAIARGAKMLGIEDFWGKVANEMSANWSSGKVQTLLKSIVRRRNQIVHEADLILQTSARTVKMRTITRAGAQKTADFTRDFVEAIDKVA